MEQLQPLSGSWKCGAVKMTVKAGLRGQWQEVTLDQPGQKSQKARSVRGWQGWDAGAKKFVRALFGSLGDYEISSSPGWEGDKLVWTGELHNYGGGLTGPVRRTLQRKGKSITESFEMQKEGKWEQAGACEFRK